MEVPSNTRAVVPMPFVVLNGQMLHREQALVPVADRGLRFGDGVFETILIRDGAPYLLDYHLRRMEKGLAALSMAYPTAALPLLARSLIETNNAEHGILRIILTRGSGSLGYLPRPESGEDHPTLIMETEPLPPAPPEEIRLCVSRYEKPSPRALPVACKTLQGLNSVLARMEADHKHCFDGILLNRRKHICETSASNLFWYRRGRLFTPSLHSGCLAGVMRERLIELSEYPLTIGAFPLRRLMKADGVILTNSTQLVIPVTHVEGREKPFAFSHTLAQILRMRIEQDIAHKSLAAGD